MKKLRLPRPAHGVLCILGILLILTAVRLFCGPPAVWSPEGALRKAERSNLLLPGEVETTWDRMRFRYMAVRGQEGQLRLFQTHYRHNILAPQVSCEIQCNHSHSSDNSRIFYQYQLHILQYYCLIL